jgi:hypothetical protein
MRSSSEELILNRAGSLRRNSRGTLALEECFAFRLGFPSRSAEHSDDDCDEDEDNKLQTVFPSDLEREDRWQEQEHGYEGR